MRQPLSVLYVFGNRVGRPLDCPGLAASKMAPNPSATGPSTIQPAIVQFNVNIPSDKLRALALAWDSPAKDLLEAFIDELHDETPANVLAPDAVVWAKPRD